MSLRGSLETFALTEVLTMVASTGKSGELQVDGEALTGRVWLDDGEVVAARVGDHTDPADAVFRLLCLTQGEFRFETGDDASAAPQPGDPQPVADVLAAAEARLAEWREIEAVVPSADYVVHLQRPPGGGDVRLDPEQWEVVVALRGGRSLEDLMADLAQDDLTTGRVVKALVEAGLAAVAPPAPKRTARRVAEAPAPAEDAGVADEEGRTDLVRQLASLNAATYEADEPAGGSAADTAADAAGDAGTDELAGATEDSPEDAESPGQGADETVNRGMLLKFLSSVRT